MSKDIGILDPDGKNKNPLTDKEYTETYRNLAKVWSKFPAYNEPKKIIKDIQKHNVVLVISGTGSGKTVLFPKYVLHTLDYKGKVIITLPKKMIAKSAAEFAAATLDVEVGKEVGYQYKDSGKGTHSEDTKLLYCTDGTLVSRLLTDPELKGYDSVIIDEAHERKINIDFLLYLLKTPLEKRPEFKLVIMSATINQELFREYYQEYKFISLEIGAKTNYPIESIFLDHNLDSDKNEYMKKGISIINDIINGSKDEGGIIMFVTSVSETNKACEMLSLSDPTFADRNICVPVFSGMTSEKQKIATDKEYYRGFVKNGRKIIIATNVAESSLTIEGITYVIDSGMELKTRFDPIGRVNLLEKGFITHAQAKQRMGRTGRTGAGKCYHLYTKDTFENKMEKFPAPSIRTDSLSGEILRLINLVGSVGELKKTFKKFIEPPSKDNVEKEIEYLERLNLIKSDKITDLGKLIVSLRTEPEQGLSIIMAHKLGCFREVIAIFAIINEIKGSIKNLFYAKNKLEKVKEQFNNDFGDHIALLKVFKEYEENKDNNDWFSKNMIKKNVLDRAHHDYKIMKRRYRNELESEEFAKTDETLENIELKYRITAALMYGFQLNIINKQDKNFTKDDGTVTNITINDSYIIAKSTQHTLYYHELFKFDKRPVQAKIVSKYSKKSEKIIESILGIK